VNDNGSTEDLVAEQIAYHDAVSVSYEEWANGQPGR
jgi:hypothetical protein